MTVLRFSSTVPDKRAVAENARDTIAALGERVRGRLVKISGYAATGTTANRIPLQPTAGRRAQAALLVRAYASSDPGGDLSATARINFYHDDKGIGVYEPSGLVANTKYDLTFLVLE